MEQVVWADHLTWLIEIVILLALAILVSISIRGGFKKLAHHLHTHRKTGEIPVMEGFITALSLPLRLLIWITVLAVIADIILAHWTTWEVPSPTPKILRLAIVLAVTWFILRWKNKIHDALADRAQKGKSRIERHQLEAVGKLVTLLVLLIAVITILQVLGLNLSALVAIGGFGTLAVGLAGKDVFANFFSGVMLYFTHPFNIGDRIQVPEKAIEGIVEEIGWYLTCIRGYDKRPIYVPNSVFSTVQVVNGTRQTNRRIRLTLTLRYQDIDLVDAIAKDIEQMLRGREDLEHLPTSTARLSSYGDYALEILVQAFTRTKKWAEFMNVQQNVLVQCGEIIRQHGADFAYPTTTISLDQARPITVETIGTNRHN